MAHVAKHAMRVRVVTEGAVGQVEVNARDITEVSDQVASAKLTPDGHHLTSDLVHVSLDALSGNLKKMLNVCRLVVKTGRDIRRLTGVKRGVVAIY